ncbi:MAG: hypothetical protein OEZ34_05845 [Spirochaetia bacterium]|nr:hypothetical protein [Spirochaetia bacterium]
MKRIAVLIILILLCSVLHGCSLHDSQLVIAKNFNGIGRQDIIGIGNISLYDDRYGLISEENLKNEIEFSFAKNGIETFSSYEFNSLLKDADLPGNRPLGENEILYLSDQFPGQYILQGGLQIYKNGDLLSERYSYIFNCSLYDSSTGKRMLTLKIIRSNLKQISGGDLHMLAERVSQKIYRIRSK